VGLLETINSPADLTRLPRARLPELAAEIRRTIVDVVARTGGHLAPSLGTVDLAIAIHYVFDTPNDKLIWDVGHQAYAHKILTGRRESFHTLRQHQGISGFTRRSESPFDAFTTGHSGTSISAGFGIACGKFLKQEESKVIAVIGDGSLTAGLAFEGLNQTGGILKRNFIVILNDNEMSISRNVGALSSFLSRTFSSKKLRSCARNSAFFSRNCHGSVKTSTSSPSAPRSPSKPS
jgi:1-deoxy-D-xylulose-5-phosphate synthase